MSALGLVGILGASARANRSHSSSCAPCEARGGRGYVRRAESVCFEIFRAVRVRRSEPPPAAGWGSRRRFPSACAGSSAGTGSRVRRGARGRPRRSLRLQLEPCYGSNSSTSCVSKSGTDAPRPRGHRVRKRQVALPSPISCVRACHGSWRGRSLPGSASLAVAVSLPVTRLGAVVDRVVERRSRSARFGALPALAPGAGVDVCARSRSAATPCGEARMEIDIAIAIDDCRLVAAASRRRRPERRLRAPSRRIRINCAARLAVEARGPLRNRFFAGFEKFLDF